MVSDPPSLSTIFHNLALVCNNVHQESIVPQFSRYVFMEATNNRSILQEISTKTIHPAYLTFPVITKLLIPFHEINCDHFISSFTDATGYFSFLLSICCNKLASSVRAGIPPFPPSKINIFQTLFHIVNIPLLTAIFALYLFWVLDPF